MSEFYIRGTPYSSVEIEKLTQDNFTIRKIQAMPTSLYKYFPNSTDLKNGRNYSQEALKNNTVYLQQPSQFDDPYDCTALVDEEEFARYRIAYYAQLCGLSISDEWDYSRIATEFSCFLHQGLEEGKRLFELFPLHPNSNNLVELQNEIFALSLETDLHKLQPSDAIWGQMFYRAIHQEYVDLHSNLMQKFRVSCFTESPYSMLMWSHYADNHKGLCIEYEIPPYAECYSKLYHNLMPVIYSDERVPILSQCVRFLQQPRLTPDILWDIYKYGILMKSMIWKYQNEWRLVSWDDMLSNDDCYNCKFFRIKRVYLGNRMNKQNRLEIIEICKDKKIPYTGVMLVPNKYEMVPCTQLCEKCPRLVYDEKNNNNL